MSDSVAIHSETQENQVYQNVTLDKGVSLSPPIEIIVHYEVLKENTLVIEEGVISQQNAPFQIFTEVERFLVEQKNIVRLLVPNKSGSVSEFYIDPQPKEEHELFSLLVICIDKSGRFYYLSARDRPVDRTEVYICIL
jgi:hypothetical protein